MKTSRIFTMALCAMVVAMGATSCKKDNNGNAGDRMTIGANIGQHGGDGAKTVIGDETDDQFPILWSDGDAFTLYSKTNLEGTSFGITSGVGSESAVFEGANPGGAPYFASYPAGVTRTGETTFTYEIPQDQTGLNHAGPMVGYSADGQSVGFENAMSWVRIGLKGNAKVTKVEMSYDESKGASIPLSGTLTITVDASGKISSTSVRTSHKAAVPSLYRTCDVTLTADYQYFDFLVPEGAFSGSTGAKFKVYGTGDAKLATFAKDMPAIERNKVYVGVFETPINDAPATPKFSVSATTTVEFAPGNLYWNGSAFHFEANQWSSASTWNASHVSHFFWSKDAAEAIKEEFNWEQPMLTADEFFTNSSSFQVDGETAGTWRTLTRDEWNYLLGYDPEEWTKTEEYGRPHAKSLCAWKELDGGTHNGLVILPDDADASVMESITSTEALATHGAVFLPAAGYRYTGVNDVGLCGYYWSGTPSGDNERNAYYMLFDWEDVLVYLVNRDRGRAVRLVRNITE